jgi:putative methyltransferase (TIGR04325 family)
MKLRLLASEFLPPVAYRFLGRLTHQSIAFSGNFPKWADAKARSSGYADGSILEHVSAATREVVAGRAAFERDSALYEVLEPPFQLLTPILRLSIRHRGPIEVIDFGGSLGSSSRLCQAFLPEGTVSRWYVVEQPAFVARGQAEFTTPALKFVHSLDELPPAEGPRLMLMSGVIQYLESPDDWVDRCGMFGAQTLVIDRTPVWGGAEHWLCVQRVPPSIYRASYPCWILSRDKLLSRITKHMVLAATFSGTEGTRKIPFGPRFSYSGFILDRPVNSAEQQQGGAL